MKGCHSCYDLIVAKPSPLDVMVGSHSRVIRGFVDNYLSLGYENRGLALPFDPAPFLQIEEGTGPVETDRTFRLIEAALQSALFQLQEQGLIDPSTPASLPRLSSPESPQSLQAHLEPVLSQLQSKEVSFRDLYPLEQVLKALHGATWAMRVAKRDPYGAIPALAGAASWAASSMVSAHAPVDEAFQVLQSLLEVEAPALA